MKTLEYNHGGNWFDRLNNAIAVDADRVKTAAFAWDAEGPYCPARRSLYYNGAVMGRVTWPLGVFVHLRFADDHRSQFGAGFKLNGRFGLVFRPWHSDASAAQGAHENAPNVDQAVAWQRGTA